MSTDTELREAAEKLAEWAYDCQARPSLLTDFKDGAMSVIEPLLATRDAEILKLKTLAAQAVGKIGNLELQLAAARKESERLDWLETEMEREKSGGCLGVSLFRRNFPITRETIDAARAAEEKT